MAATSPTSQEFHVLVNPSGQQVRELQPLDVAHPSDHPSAGSRHRETVAELDVRIRWRVVCISSAIAVYVVINAIVQSIFDMASMQEMLDKVRTVTHEQARGPSAATYVMNMVPSVGFSITIGLLVPLCGYLGVKQNQQGLVGCFCCCSCVNCCCALVSMVGLFFFGTALAAMKPSVELFFYKCDPMQCMANATDEAHIVDCLATGVWQEYKPQFTGYHFPAKGVCPPTFLRCGSVPEEPEGFGDPFGGGYEDVSAPVREVSMGDYSKSLASDVQMATSESFPHSHQFTAFRHQGLRRLRLPTREDRLGSLFAPRAVHEDPASIVPLMPREPLKDCHPAKAGKRFHQIRMLVPAIYPKIQTFISVNVVLLVPVFVLGCLGFCWGKDLFSRLNEAGYNPVGTTRANHARPQVLLHPALGPAAGHATDNALQTTQLQMAQPLILNVPPTPPPLTVATPQAAPSAEGEDTVALLPTETPAHDSSVGES